MGLAAKRSHQVARGAGGERREVRRAVHAEPAAPAALGRLSARARSMGVLARPQVAPARPAALPARHGRRLDPRAACALTDLAVQPEVRPVLRYRRKALREAPFDTSG